MKKSGQSAWWGTITGIAAIAALGMTLAMVPRTAQGQVACVGDCNDDGMVTVDELITMVNIALGAEPVSACEAGDANGDGTITIDEVITAVGNALNGCPVVNPVCGNGVVDPGEDCDDGGICMGGSTAGTACTSDDDCGASEPGECLAGTKAFWACNSDADCPDSTCVRCRPFGGDGCAANCTNETEHTSTLVPGVVDGQSIQDGTSGSLVYADVATIPLPLSGTQSIISGTERDGQITFVQKPEGTQLPRIPVQTIACACVRGVAPKTCGGTRFEIDGTASTPCEDNFTDGESACDGKNPCTFVFGPGNSGYGVVGCDSLPNVSYDVVQDGCVSGPCDGVDGMIGPNVMTFTSEVGGPGSQVLFANSAIGTITGSCTGTAEGYGPDHEYCTDDDPYTTATSAVNRGTPSVTTLTTGTASGFVPNGNLLAGNDIPFTGPVSVTGATKSCTDLLAGNFSGLIQAGAFVTVGDPTQVLGDIVVVTKFVSE